MKRRCFNKFTALLLATAMVFTMRCYQSGIRCKDKGKKEDHVDNDFFEADRGTEQEADR